MFDPQSELSINHVAAAERADLVAVVPATANSLAKIAHGRADDRVSADDSRHPRPRPRRARDGRQYVRQPRDAGQRQASQRARRLYRRPGRGQNGLRACGQGPARRTRRTGGTHKNPARTRRRPRGPQDSRQRGRHPRGHRPRSRHSQPLIRQDGLRHSRGRHGTGARTRFW